MAETHELGIWWKPDSIAEITESRGLFEAEKKTFQVKQFQQYYNENFIGLNQLKIWWILLWIW